MRHFYLNLLLCIILSVMLCVSTLGVEYEERTVVSGNISHFVKQFTYTSTLDTSEQGQSALPSITPSPSNTNPPEEEERHFKMCLFDWEHKPLGGNILIEISQNSKSFYTGSDGCVILDDLEPGTFEVRIHWYPETYEDWFYNNPLFNDFWIFDIDWDGKGITYNKTQSGVVIW